MPKTNESKGGAGKEVEDKERWRCLSRSVQLPPPPPLTKPHPCLASTHYPDVVTFSIGLPLRFNVRSDKSWEKKKGKQRRMWPGYQDEY